MNRALALLLLTYGSTVLTAGCASSAPLDPVDAIADRVRKRETPTDAELGTLCEKAQRRHVDALFQLLEPFHGAEHAFQAVTALSLLLTSEDVPALRKLLDSKDPRRAILLIRQARFAPASLMLLDQARLFLTFKGDTPKVTLGALGALRLRDSTQAILDYLDRDDADFRTAMRALGRIWEQKLDTAPLEPKDEHRRLTVLALAHGLGMRADDKDALEAMLRVMTSKELDEFLAKHAKDKFSARGQVAAVCEEQAFDAKKGALVHRALLANADGDLVALILWSSPHALAPVRLLDDTRGAKLRGVPEARLCDYAAARLEAEEAKKNPVIDESKDAREKLLKKWRGRQPQ